MSVNMTPELLLSQLQRVSLADLKQVLTQGGRPVYPPLSRKTTSGLTISSEITDVQAAARAAGFQVTPGASPVLGPETGSSEGLLQIVKPGQGTVGAAPHELVFLVPVRPTRPLIQLADAQKQGHTDFTRIPNLRDVATQVIRIAQWIEENNIKHLHVTAPAAYVVLSQRDADPGAGPLAGDLIYLLGMLPSLLSDRRPLPTTALTSPVDGMITAVGSGAIQIQGNKDYGPELSALATRVYRLRQVAKEAEERYTLAWRAARSAGTATHAGALSRLQHAEKARDAAVQELKAAAPALADEAARGYPSLDVDTSIPALTRAVQRLYGKPGGRVLLASQELTPFRTFPVPRRPEDQPRCSQLQAEITRCQARIAEIDRDQEQREVLLRKLSARDPELLATVAEERTLRLAQMKEARREHQEGPSGFSLAELAGLKPTSITARPTPHPSGASEAELGALSRAARIQAEAREAVDEKAGLEAEQREAEQELQELQVLRLEFKGRIFLEVTVSTRLPSGRVLAPLPDLTVGTAVRRGQPLTETQMKVTPSSLVKAPPAARRAIPLSLRLDGTALNKIGNLLAPSADRQTTSYLPVDYAPIRPDQVGVITVPDVGDVYAVLADSALVSFDAAVRKSGGFGPFLVAFGFLPASKVVRLPETTRNMTALSQKSKEAFVAQILDEKNKYLADWVMGRRGLTLLHLTAAPPAHIVTGELAADKVKIGSHDKSSDIAQITMYEFWQERPVETAPIRTRQTRLLTGQNTFAEATAAVLNHIDMRRHQAAMVGEMAKKGTKEEKAALITPEDEQEAARKAAAFGTTPRDRAYVSRRLRHARLQTALAGHPEALALIQSAQGGKSATQVQIVAALRRADPATYNNLSPAEIMARFEPEPSEVSAEIAQMREKMSKPRLTDDPMWDVLLVAELKPDRHGNKQASIELIPDLEDMKLRRGQGGAQLGRLIEAFKRAPELGYVPSRYPKGKEEKAVRTLYSEARQLSAVSAEAAARLGMNYAHRGQFGVQKTGSGGSRASAIVTPGFSVETGRGGSSPLPSFGMISGTGPQARRQMMMSRLPAAATANIEAPMGLSVTGLNQMTGRYQDARKEADPALLSLTMTRAERAEAERAKQKEQAAIRAEFAAGFDLNSSFLSDKENPLRAFRRLKAKKNPVSPDMLDALLMVPADARPGLAQAAGALEAAKSGGILTPAQETGVKYLGAVCAVASVLIQRIPAALRDSEEIITALADQVYRRTFLSDAFSVMQTGTPLSVDLTGIQIDVDKTTASLMEEVALAGPFYRIDLSGRLSLRRSRTIGTLFGLSPLLGVWLEQIGTVPPDLAQGLQEAIGPIGASKLEQAEAAADGTLARPPTRLVERLENRRVVRVAGLCLTAPSQALLVGFQQRPAPAEGLDALRTQAETAYKAVLTAVSNRQAPDPARLEGLIEAYEQAVRRLQEKIQASQADADPAFASQVESRLSHFLFGRVAPGEDRPSVERRLQALMGSAARGEAPVPGPVGLYLDFYGRPVFPIPPETLKAAGVRPIDYGGGQTLGGRLTLRQAAGLVRQSGKGDVATSTLEAKPGVGRGLREFGRPYTGFKPACWAPNSILNVIWLSPDGQIARIYRAGAMVAMFRRAPADSLLEFLKGVAENWNLWLTDPQHKRELKQSAQIVWLGQSGDAHGLLYRVNTNGDRVPLGSNTLPRRLAAAEAQVKGDHIVPAVKPGTARYEAALQRGLLKVWGTPEEISQDAEIYMSAMEAAGYAQNSEVETEMKRILGGVGLSKPADTASTTSGRVPSLVVLFSPTGYYKKTDNGVDWVPTGGTGTVPTGIEDTVYPFIGTAARAFPQVKLLDRSFKRTARRAGTLAAAGKLSPQDLVVAQTRVLPMSPLAELLVELTAEEPAADTKFLVLAGSPSRDLAPAEKEIEEASKGSIMFSPAVRAVSEDSDVRLLEEALRSPAPILVVETQDVPADSSEANKKLSGLGLLADVYIQLRNQDRVLQTPVVYAYPAIRGDTSVQQALTSMRVYLARELAVEPGKIRLYALSFEQLAAHGLASLGVAPVRANPRRKSLHRRG